MKTRLARIIELNNTADHVLQFITVRDNQGNVINDEEVNQTQSGHPLLKAGAIAGIGAGGYLGGRALVNKYPVQGAAVKDAAGAAYNSVKGAAQKGMAYGKEVLPGISSAVKNVGSGIGGKAAALLEKLKGVKLSSRHDRLIALNVLADEVLSFDETEPLKNRYGQRAVLGNPLTILVHGKKGERFAGAGEAYGNMLKHQVIGTGVGAAGGAGIGAAGGALAHLLQKSKGGGGKLGELARIGAGAGALGGAYLGGAYGGIKGNFGKEATDIYKRRVGN